MNGQIELSTVIEWRVYLAKETNQNKHALIFLPYTYTNLMAIDVAKFKIEKLSKMAIDRQLRREQT